MKSGAGRPVLREFLKSKVPVGRGHTGEELGMVRRFVGDWGCPGTEVGR